MWPLSAFAAWALAWAVCLGVQALGASDLAAFIAATLLGVALSLFSARRWRRVAVAAGFPLSVLLTGALAGVSPWLWLLPFLALLALYPVSAWRDAPMFPTPAGALDGLAGVAVLPGREPCVVDAGCGLGDALRELHGQYPKARLVGLERSALLRWLCALRCRWLGVPVDVRRADIWQADWAPYAMVYLFQRPESMPRAVSKAARELRRGAWMASLEFEALALRPTAVHRCADGRDLWLYRAPFKERG